MAPGPARGGAAARAVDPARLRLDRACPGVGDVAFVDVPGHERFVATTLSGVGPVPVVLFVVAADDPWMPQAAEHLAALDALGVDRGVLVVTRSDLADPAPALARARDELARTSLRGLPGRLRERPDRCGPRRAARPAGRGAARHVPRPTRTPTCGSGSTGGSTSAAPAPWSPGTLPAGTVRVGDTLQVDGGGSAVRVRGLESLGDDGRRGRRRRPGGARPGRPGARAPHPGHGADHARRVRAGRRGRRTAAGGGGAPERPMLHVGSDRAWRCTRGRWPRDLVRLRLDAAAAAADRRPRRAARPRRAGGLWGVEVLDPAPPSLRRRGAATARARALADADGTLADEARRRGVVRRSRMRRLGARDGALPDGAVVVGDWVVSPGRAAALRRELAAVVRRASTPFDPGLTLGRGRAGARPARHRRWSPPWWSRRCGSRAGGCCRRDDGLPPALARALEAAAPPTCATTPFAAPDAGRLRELGLDAGGAGVAGAIRARAADRRDRAAPRRRRPGGRAAGRPAAAVHHQRRRARRSAPRDASRCRCWPTSTAPAAPCGCRTTAAGSELAEPPVWDPRSRGNGPENRLGRAVVDGAR